MPDDDLVSVRYMVDDVEESIDFYTHHFGFAVRSSAAPAFADVVRGRLRLLLSGPKSSAGRPVPARGRPGELGGGPDARRARAGARRLEPHPLRGRRPGGRGRTPARRRGALPQR